MKMIVDNEYWIKNDILISTCATQCTNKNSRGEQLQKIPW
jgi:hypothetical protein